MAHSPTEPLACPICDSPIEVYDSRPEGKHVRRRRQCKNGHKFNTLEVVVGAVRSGNYHTRQVEPPVENNYDGDVEADLRAEAEGG